jgi:hypothetical protein
MNQALYAHMNNKRKMKKKRLFFKRLSIWSLNFYLLLWILSFLFFFTFLFLFAYISCTKWFHYDIFCMCPTYSWSNSSPLLFPLPSLPFLEQFQYAVLTIFIHVYEVLWPYSSPSLRDTLYICSSPLAGIHSQTGPVLHSSHSFLRTRFCI